MEETEVVQTVQGKVRGVKLKTQLGVPYYSFRGIPYAKPPVGSLRFQLPEPAEPWEGIKDAIEIPPVAPQIGLFTGGSLGGEEGYGGDEDCLYINVFTPEIPKDKTSTQKPVMVYIHGGGYYIGSGNNEMHGPGRFMNKGEVVLVTMNYRLGVLGFLSTGDSVIPGNLGLKDQVLSLKWVQQNIAKFGGDPGNVTIAGVSAGGSSTHLHLFSPMSKGLFHKAIAQSGSAFSYWSAQDTEYARSKAFRLGETLGKKTNDSKELLEFLRTIPTKELIEAGKKTVSEDEKHPLSGMFYLPVVERGEDTKNTFLPEKPLELIRKGQYNSVPIIMGVTSREGLIITQDFFQSLPWYTTLDNGLEPVLNLFLGLEKGTSLTREREEKIRKFYFEDKRISQETFNELVDLYGDILFNMWAERSAREHLKMSKDPFYYYQFSFKGDFMFMTGMEKFEVAGVSHGMDLMYLFEVSFADIQYLDPDTETMKTSERILRMWINFAKSGNPTPNEDSLLGVTWKPYTKEETNYLDIDSPLTINKCLNQKAMDFWDKILPEEE